MWLRSKVLPSGEEAYIRSLSRSIQWNARGGKSGSNFSKSIGEHVVQSIHGLKLKYINK